MNAQDHYIRFRDDLYRELSSRGLLLSEIGSSAIDIVIRTACSTVRPEIGPTRFRRELRRCPDEIGQRYFRKPKWINSGGRISPEIGMMRKDVRAIYFCFGHCDIGFQIHKKCRIDDLLVYEIPAIVVAEDCRVACFITHGGSIYDLSISKYLDADLHS